MPFLFLITGVVFVVSATLNTQGQLLTLLRGDFTGKGNFIYWLAAILLIGAVGYIPDLKPVSRAFLVLVVIVLFINNKGVFANFIAAMNQTQQSSATSTASNPLQGLAQGSVLQ
jgi:hypothetical protein